MKLYHKRNFLLALLGTAAALACLSFYFVNRQELRLLICGGWFFVFACVNYNSAFSPKAAFDDLALDADERDKLIAMKTSQMTIRIVSQILLVACLVSVVIYPFFRNPVCIAATVILCVVSILLFVVTLFTNLYYETHC